MDDPLLMLPLIATLVLYGGLIVHASREMNEAAEKGTLGYRVFPPSSEDETDDPKEE